MFGTIFSSTTSVSTRETIICLVVALVLGFVLAGAYILANRKKKYSTTFALTMVLLPAVVAVVIIMVGSDIARAVSLGGVFALVRFRSIPGDAKDILNVFLAMAVGLACGVGCITLAAVIAVTIGAIYVILSITNFAVPSNKLKELKITIPENLNYYGAFDDLFEEYTTSCELVKVKTANLGTLYTVTYYIVEKKGIDEKKFLDSIRCRNGNLNLSIGMIEEKESL